MKTKRWSIAKLNKTLKINVKDYSSAIAVAALFKNTYGEFPKMGLSGMQASMADELIKVLPRGKVK